MLAKRKKTKVKMKDNKSQRRATSQALQAHEVCSAGRSRIVKQVQFKRPIVAVQYFTKDDMPNKVNSLQSNIFNMTKISNVKVKQKAPGHFGRMDKALEVTKVPSAVCDSGCTGAFVKPKDAKAS